MLDRFDNLVLADNSQVTVSLGQNPVGGTLSGTKTVSAIAGIATFSNLSIDKVGAGYVLRAVDGTLGTAKSASFDITPAAADHLAFNVQPTNSTAGVSIAPPVTVRVLDRFNNLVTTDQSNVTLTIGTNPSGGTLSGTTTMAAVNGVATFAGMSIDKAGIGYTLSAADGSLTGATTAAFNITAAAPHHLGFSVQPNNTIAGVFINPAVKVQVLDQFGNLVMTDVSNVTIAIGYNPSSGGLSGTKTISAVNGVATFADLSIDKTGADYTLSATNGSLIAATSTTFNITHAAAHHLAFDVQPTNAVAGHAISPAVTVRVFDRFNNLAVSDTSTVTLAIGTNVGGGTLSGTKTFAAVNGVASFDDVSVNKAGVG